jgi:rfaE bifunctional protein nucleotidyltransferase chain/domain
MTDPIQNVLSLEATIAYRQDMAAQGKRVVLTNGCFDLLHFGHFNYLRESAMLGDALIVGVNSDWSVKELKGPTRPINIEQHRAYALASLKAVCRTFIFQGPRFHNEIAQIKPDLYTKAGDYTIDTLPVSERDALKAAGTDVHFLQFLEGHSTTQTIEQINH